MRNTLLIFLSCLVLSSCVKKDTSLLNLLPVETTFNPNTEVLLGAPESRIADVQIGPGGLIEGFTDLYRFRTPDNFNNFLYAPLATPHPYYDLTVDGSYLYHVTKNNFRFDISYSTNYGETWQVFTLDTEDTIPFYLYTSVNVSDILFKDDQSMIVAVETRQEGLEFNYYEYKSWIYRVTLATGGKQLISVIEGFRPSSLHVSNNRLWLLLNKYTLRQGTYYDLNNGYIVRSDDGGTTWTQPVLIDNEGKVEMAAGSENNLFAFSPQKSAYYSNNGGDTWSVSNQADPRFLSAQFTDASTIFSGTDNVVHKSVDGGVNWTPYNEIVQNNYVHGKVRFLNNSTGVVFNDANLFLTTDGGATWQLILSKAFVF